MNNSNISPVLGFTVSTLSLCSENLQRTEHPNKPLLSKIRDSQVVKRGTYFTGQVFSKRLVVSCLVGTCVAHTQIQPWKVVEVRVFSSRVGRRRTGEQINKSTCPVGQMFVWTTWLSQNFDLCTGNRCTANPIVLTLFTAWWPCSGLLYGSL